MIDKSTRSEKSHARLGRESRTRKAKKIITLVSPYRGLKDSDVLDVGTGAGVIASELSKKAKSVTSVDLWDERIEKTGYKFKEVNSEKLPFKNNSFDIVLSNHVVEHVPDQELHIKEMLRVVRPGGVIYLATPNRAWIKDPHYKLPFINWLPRRYATIYLKKAKGKEWDIYPQTHFTLKKIVGGEGKMIKMVPAVIKQTGDSLDTFVNVRKVLARLPGFLLVPIQYFGPTLLYIIVKETD